MKNINRRNFIRKTSMAGAAIAIAPSIANASSSFIERPYNAKYMGDFAAPKLETVRAAFIGVGARGPGHLKFIAQLPGTEVVAISDLYQDSVERWGAKAKEIGGGKRHKKIKLYHGNENQWKVMLDEVKPDVVFIATNWATHAPMAIEAMKKGAHAFVEVPIAVSLDEMWEIVDTSEKTQKHCMMMENVNYGRDELMYLNMCRQGLIGEPLHAEAAYIHDLRFQMEEQERGTGSWRTHHYANRNGNLYPTHGLGPVAQYMNLGRTDDNFGSLVSFSTPAIGRKLYAEKNYAADHKWNKLDFKGGDLNTSIIKTNLGRTIMVQWDETSPRPYSRHNMIQGTKGILAGFPTRVALEGGVEGLTKNHHSWVQGDQLDALYEEYDHPLYKRLSQSTQGSGHGGMDGMMRYRIIECLQKRTFIESKLIRRMFVECRRTIERTICSKWGCTSNFP